MSHEIRTPLNGIIGMTELALETELTREQREYLETVKVSADLLLNVINDILDFSKIEAGKVHLELRPFNLRDRIEKIFCTLGLRAAEKDLELLCEICHDIPETVIGDPGRVGQIVLNLVGNALKFTKKGEVGLKVHAESIEDGAATLHFEVSDTGAGIPAEKLTTIFDAFGQADTSTTRIYGGTGLGLTISRQLIRMMGGRIWVESEPGVGSHFHFTVKLGIGGPQTAVAGTVARRDLAGVKVLIVDDNRANRQILERTVQRWGMIPTPCHDAVTALAELASAAADKSPYTIVLTDMHMPEMDGFGLVEQINQRPELAALTIMMLSSGGQGRDTARCEELGISDYLLKPVRSSELLEAMRRVLSLPGDSPGPLPDGALTVRRLRVLLAEDNPVNQMLAKILLEKRGHHVVVAATGAEALLKLETGAFDLVLMDIQMPVMDGLEATRILREKEKVSGGRQTVFAMTAMAMTEDRQRCLDAGMDGYLTKPIRSAELFHVLDSCAAREHQEPVCEEALSQSYRR